MGRAGVLIVTMLLAYLMLNIPACTHCEVSIDNIHLVQVLAALKRLGEGSEAEKELEGRMGRLREEMDRLS